MTVDQHTAQLGLDYSNKWFEFHANQRQDVFKIFFVYCAGFLSIAGFFIERNYNFALVPLGISAIFFSLTFWMLDVRSRRLIELAERNYAEFWKAAGLPQEICPTLLSSPRAWWEFRYKHAYIATFIGVAAAGVLIAYLGYTRL